MPYTLNQDGKNKFRANAAQGFRYLKKGGGYLFQTGEQIFPISFEDDACECIQANHSAEILFSSFDVR